MHIFLLQFLFQPLFAGPAINYKSYNEVRNMIQAGTAPDILKKCYNDAYQKLRYSSSNGITGDYDESGCQGNYYYIKTCSFDFDLNSGSVYFKWTNSPTRAGHEQCRQCPGNQVFSDCHSPCVKTCQNKDDQTVCMAVCEARCGCPSGMVYETANSDYCVYEYQCDAVKECKTIQCESHLWLPKQCLMDFKPQEVKVKYSHSNIDCVENDNFNWRQHKLNVFQGCRATFEYCKNQ